MTHIKQNKNCSPSNTYDGTCLNFKALQRIATKLNNDKKFSGNKIILKNYNSKNKKKLIQEIRRKMSCNSKIDTCVLKNKNKFNKTIIESFKPIKPKGKYEWLSTLDINDVMTQYEKKFNDFIFMGAVPIDFDAIYEEIANINLKELSKLKKKIGFVFNTDPSTEGGEHWVSMMLDLNDNTLCFFDSVSDEPPKQVQKLIKRLVKQAKDINKDLTVIVNTVAHQFGNAECGIFSVYFLISRLEGKKCKEIFNKKIHDAEMNKYRDVFFRKAL